MKMDGITITEESRVSKEAPGKSFSAGVTPNG